MYCIISRSAIAGRSLTGLRSQGGRSGRSRQRRPSSRKPFRHAPFSDISGLDQGLSYLGLVRRQGDPESSNLGAKLVHLFADVYSVVIRDPPGRWLSCHANCVGILFKADLADAGARRGLWHEQSRPAERAAAGLLGTGAAAGVGAVQGRAGTCHALRLAPSLPLSGNLRHSCGQGMGHDPALIRPRSSAVPAGSIPRNSDLGLKGKGPATSWMEGVGGMTGEETMPPSVTCYKHPA